MKLTPKLHRTLHYLGFILFFVAVFMIYEKIRTYTLLEIWNSFLLFPKPTFFLACLSTILSYITFTFYDVLAISYLKRTLSYPKIAVISFLSYALSNNLGAMIISGGSVRLRLYTEHNFSLRDIGVITLFCALTSPLGIVSWNALQFVFNTTVFIPYLPLEAVSIKVIGSLFFLCIVGCGIRFPKLFLLQWSVAVVNWGLKATTFYILISTHHSPLVCDVFGIYFLAHIIGMISTVPSGYGVFEYGILLAFSKTIPTPEILTVLLMYRLIYYIIPLIIASSILVLFELRSFKK